MLVNDFLTRFLNEQLSIWELAKSNYEKLQFVEEKEFVFGTIRILAQYNPEREKSTIAKFEKTTEKMCLLCENNFPKEQIKYEIVENYFLLVNPFPIFTEHFTIAHKNHIEQNIDLVFNDLLEISRNLPENYFIFFNGAKSGASIPGHLHFQIGRKDELPIFANKIANQNQFYEQRTINRHFVISNSDNEKTKQQFIDLLKREKFNQNGEMINILAFFEENYFKIIVFLRKKHRPEFYYLSGENQILVSPASIDLAGKIIFPRKVDFEKLSNGKIEKIFTEVLF
jgi:galactose-1-phosphate uridylyltransferase